MSRLGYFVGGALVGVLGTMIAAYAADTQTSSCEGAHSDTSLKTDDNTCAAEQKNRTPQKQAEEPITA